MELFIFLIVILAVLLGIGFYFWGRRIRRRKILEGLNLVLLSIRVSKTSKENKDLKQEINLSEQLFSTLSAFKKPFIFEAVVPHIGEEIHFYLAVPGEFANAAQRQIQSIWNDARVERTEDFNVFNYTGVAACATLRLKEHFALPIRTYQEMGLDTFLPILGAFAKVNEIGEGLAFQVLVKSAPGGTKSSLNEILKNLKKGKSLEEVLKKGGQFISLADFQTALSPKKEGEEKPKEMTINEAAVKALELKLAKPLFSVNVRLVSSGSSSFAADDLLESLASTFSQFEAPQRNAFKVSKIRNPQSFFHLFSFRIFDNKESMVLNSEELASIFHLPTSFTETPRIKWLKAKEAPPPSNLPAKGVLIGQSRYRGETRSVYVSDDDRRRHVYLIGQTGTGKSTLLAQMVLEDIGNGKGVAVIDPHGDLIEQILSLIPEKRIDDVIVFDPSDINHPLGLNMLEYDSSRPEEKTFITNEMQSIFNKLFPPETMGPMFEQYMRNALLFLMEDAPNEPATLMEVPRVFTDSAFRSRKLSRIYNPAVVDFWEKEAIKAGGEAALANMTPYITSKFNNFIANDYVRPIIGQPKSAFNFREVMDEGKILLVNLSKGRIGDINAGLLGMIITGKILMAALSRVDIPQDKRRDFNLFIDEFQNFTTDSIAVILAEARKYRLNLTIAHQFIAQLTEPIRDSVFGNVGSLVVFRVGVQDAEFLAKQFESVFEIQDLINIDNFNAYVKILINGETSKPFNIKILPPVAGEAGRIETIKELSRGKYSRPRQKVEMETLKRLRE